LAMPSRSRRRPSSTLTPRRPTTRRTASWPSSRHVAAAGSGRRARAGWRAPPRPGGLLPPSPSASRAHPAAGAGGGRHLLRRLLWARVEQQPPTDGPVGLGAGLEDQRQRQAGASRGSTARGMEA
jgi:hypothetical protein